MSPAILKASSSAESGCRVGGGTLSGLCGAQVRYGLQLSLRRTGKAKSYYPVTSVLMVSLSLYETSYFSSFILLLGFIIE